MSLLFQGVGAEAGVVALSVGHINVDVPFIFLVFLEIETRHKCQIQQVNQ
jgi:hypothetical protein